MATRAAVSGLTVRHYCHGIGDCHLLKFTKTNGKPFWMLIDCGIHTSISGGPGIIDAIVADIRTTTGGQIDVLVLTHEHTDHNSAFEPSANRFGDFTVGELWMAWTESETDPQAQALDKFKQQTLTALSGVSQRLSAAQGLSPSIQSLQGGLDALLGFSFGAKGERVRAFRKCAESLPTKGIQYLEPNDPPKTITGLPNLRIYVLAPSRDEKYLRILERAGEMYRVADEASGSRIAYSLSSAIAANSDDSLIQDLAAPFDASTGSELGELARQGPGASESPFYGFARDHYFGPMTSVAPAVASRRRKKPLDPNETDQAWRRIDHDWLASSGELGLQLDNKTNNTSLVLAFELVDTGRVFLFAADAQVGSWLSWQDARWTLRDGTVVSGPDLLARTVYYKVGHHGSQNATLQRKGLELMGSPDLAAFIPTNESDAEKVGWGEMPYHGILEALERQCGERVVRADNAWVAGGRPSLRAPTGCIRAIRTGGSRPDDIEPRQCWVELDLV